MKTTAFSDKFIAFLLMFTLAVTPAVLLPAPAETHLLSCNQARGVGTRDYLFLLRSFVDALLTIQLGSIASAIRL